MNEFKKLYQSNLQEIKEKRRNEMIALINAFYERELTEKEKETFLQMKEEEMPNHIYYTLFTMAKEYIQKGKVDEKTFKKCMEIKKKKVTIEQVPEEWQKTPEKWEGK
ncbi:MAG: hypothetical protein HFJ33_06675 [Clostridia bacterium]|nr:hypothetical protein [Clostridia bacterium]